MPKTKQNQSGATISKKSTHTTLRAGGEIVAPSANGEVGESREVTLTESEMQFVEAVTTPPIPTLAEAAAKSGYDDEYARRLRHKPHIARAIEQRFEMRRRERKFQEEEIIDGIYKDAQAGDHDSRKLFLEAQGRVGRAANIQIAVGVTVNAELSDEGRAARLARAREVRVVDTTQEPGAPVRNPGDEPEDVG